jgi:hypothetical protein
MEEEEEDDTGNCPSLPLLVEVACREMRAAN